jgi:hypothetical protein
MDVGHRPNHVKFSSLHFTTSAIIFIFLCDYLFFHYIGWNNIFLVTFLKRTYIPFKLPLNCQCPYKLPIVSMFIFKQPIKVNEEWLVHNSYTTTHIGEIFNVSISLMTNKKTKMSLIFFLNKTKISINLKKKNIKKINEKRKKKI